MTVNVFFMQGSPFTHLLNFSQGIAAKITHIGTAPAGSVYIGSVKLGQLEKVEETNGNN